MIDEAAIQGRYQAIAPLVDERVRRLVLGSEAVAAGRGGQTVVARATGVSRGTLRRGIRDQAEQARLNIEGRDLVEAEIPSLRDLVESIPGASFEDLVRRLPVVAGWRLRAIERVLSHSDGHTLDQPVTEEAENPKITENVLHLG